MQVRGKVTKVWRMKTSGPEQPSRRQRNRETPFASAVEIRHGRTNRERMWSIYSFFHDHHHRLLESPPQLDSNRLIIILILTACITASGTVTEATAY
jgi:hypothetical protein